MRLLNWPASSPSENKWRWSLSVGRVFISLRTEYLSPHAIEWRSCMSEYYILGIEPKFKFGRKIHYYDGAHCVFWLGPLFFSWFSWKYGPEHDTGND